MFGNSYKPLALLAADAEDLEVFSSVLQDAVVKVGDMTYRPKERRFALVANRFVWEDGSKRRVGPFLRVRSGVHFDDVVGVRTKSLRQDAPDAVVNLLSLSFEAGAEEGTGTITLTLAGGGAIALDVESVNSELRDLSDPWRTQNKPDHE